MGVDENVLCMKVCQDVHVANIGDAVYLKKHIFTLNNEHLLHTISSDSLLPVLCPPPHTLLGHPCP